MPRQERTKSGTGIYHVMLRGINKQDMFEDDEDYLQMTSIKTKMITEPSLGHFYGKIDNLRLYYDGMQLKKVKEDALPLTYTGAFDFVSTTVGEPSTRQYDYYKDGSLKWDANKGIALITYDRYSMPARVQFTNGNRTEYEYSATGQRLKTIYRTAVPNISVPIGSTIALNASNTLSVDSVNYFGDFIFENGLLTKCLFDGGYASITNGQPTWHYYYQDHLGNIRAVVNHDGSVEQRNHYYPFGAIYGDLAYNDGLQKYKYNGKELDRMHGLNFYDYGARQYDPLLGMFTQMDPLAEKYYGVNPYAYCGNNPINAIDPNGKEKIEVLDPAKIKNQDLIEAASNFKDEKYVINIWAHGSSKGMTVYDKDKGKSVEITNTKDFKNFLNRYSKVWINRKEGEQVKIVLHSCETGKSIKGEENFAQKISSDLSNTVVVAPNRNVYTRNGHEIGTYNEAIETQGVSSNYEGRWVQYEEGKQSTTYRGSSLPGSAGYRYVTSNSPWYIKVLNFWGIK